jgi:REP element-mobilizing transposase RayT
MAAMSPIRSFKVTHRNLPHWQVPGATYFLTWRMIDNLVLEPDDRTIALNAIRFWDGKRWVVYAAVIMPDHAHALVRPMPLDPGRLVEGPVHDLADLLGSVKKFSSRRINTRRNRDGMLWQDERYDHIQRDEREFEETWTYIRYNPVRAGLCELPEQYPWLYESATAE